MAPLLALRNAIGVAIPLAVGAATGHSTIGLIGTLGALNVAFSDGTDPYLHRLRRMLGASLCCALAVFAGGLCGRNPTIAVPLVAACAFAAGMIVAVGPAATDIANVTLVTLIVFSSQAMTAPQAASSGLAALSGGLLQTLLSLAPRPFRPYGPERRVLADLFRELARSAGSRPSVTEAPPGTAESIAARTALTSLSGDHSIESERYLALLSQAERIRLALLTLSRLRVRIAREEETGQEVAAIDRNLEVAGSLLGSIGACLASGCAVPAVGSIDATGVRKDARRQLDALAGQLRAAAELAAHATPAGSTLFEQREAEQPWALRLAGAMAVLKANLHLQSPALRHAVRLSFCVAAGELLAHYVSWARPYWIPMTAAIVLRPDFTTTWSRGLLRVAGTLAGLGMATALFHMLTPSGAVEVMLIAVFAFLLRCFGPANYGIFAANLSALVVLMFAATGVDPGPVILARALNTFVGGALALAAYQLWPTWERTLVSEALAGMLDGYRTYLQVLREAYEHPERSFAAELDGARQAGRLARTHAEASVARLATEPGVKAERLAEVNALLANSHRLAHATMSLEAGLARSRAAPARDAFRPFAEHVDLTLYYLAAALRGADVKAADLPDLREDHNALTHSGDPRVERYALVNVEADRIANSLNTLAEMLLPRHESMSAN